MLRLTVNVIELNMNYWNTNWYNFRFKFSLKENMKFTKTLSFAWSQKLDKKINPKSFSPGRKFSRFVRRHRRMFINKFLGLFLLNFQCPSTIFRQKKRTTRMARPWKRKWWRRRSKALKHFAFGIAAGPGWSFKRVSHGLCSTRLLNCSSRSALLSTRCLWLWITTIWTERLRKYWRLETM